MPPPNAREGDAPPQPSATQAAVAGAVAGGVTRMIAAPLDLIKIRFQVQQAPISRATGHQHAAKYVTLLQSLRSIHSEEGLRSFWRGNLAATGLWVSYSAIQFGCYRSLGGLWSEHFVERHGAAVSTLNGALAGVVATAATYPLDLFRTVLASQGVPKQFPTMRSLAAHTWAARGVRGFYSGLGATLFQIAPYMGLSFGLYASLNAAAAARVDLAHASGAALALSYVGAGAVAGLLSKLAVYPLDTVKKRMQMRQVPRCATYGVIPHYASSLACLRGILRREGLRGLYKGTAPSLLKSVVAHSSTFATYEAALSASRNCRRLASATSRSIDICAAAT
ncbi:hypothetical protein PybrP1_000340 [[Pythium] brassicae (nom. inval.)]|nr:hypothetical protein PybrP1_000340 [[Pythium] brassicae (nom. inval.)]